MSLINSDSNLQFKEEFNQYLTQLTSPKKFSCLQFKNGILDNAGIGRIAFEKLNQAWSQDSTNKTLVEWQVIRLIATAEKKGWIGKDQFPLIVKLAQRVGLTSDPKSIGKHYELYALISEIREKLFSQKRYFHPLSKNLDRMITAYQLNHKNELSKYPLPPKPTSEEPVKEKLQEELVKPEKSQARQSVEQPVLQPVTPVKVEEEIREPEAKSTENEEPKEQELAGENELQQESQENDLSMDQDNSEHQNQEEQPLVLQPSPKFEASVELEIKEQPVIDLPEIPKIEPILPKAHHNVLSISQFFESFKTQLGNLSQTNKTFLIASVAAAVLTPLAYFYGRRTNINNYAVDIYRPPNYGFTPIDPEYFSLEPPGLKDFVLQKQLNKDFPNRFNRVGRLCENENRRFEEIYIRDQIKSLRERAIKVEAEKELTKNSQLVEITPIPLLEKILADQNNESYLKSISDFISNIDFNQMADIVSNEGYLNSISNLLGRIEYYKIAGTVSNVILATLKIGISIIQTLSNLPKCISFPLAALGYRAYYNRYHIKNRFLEKMDRTPLRLDIFFGYPHENIKTQLAVDKFEEAFILKNDPLFLQQNVSYIAKKKLTLINNEEIILKPGHFLIPFEIKDESDRYTSLPLSSKNYIDVMSCIIFIPSNLFKESDKVDLKWGNNKFLIQLTEEDKEKVLELRNSLYSKSFEMQFASDNDADRLLNHWKKCAIKKFPDNLSYMTANRQKKINQINDNRLIYVDKQRSLWLGSTKYSLPILFTNAAAKEKEKEKENNKEETGINRVYNKLTSIFI